MTQKETPPRADRFFEDSPEARAYQALHRERMEANYAALPSDVRAKSERAEADYEARKNANSARERFAPKDQAARERADAAASQRAAVSPTRAPDLGR